MIKSDFTPRGSRLPFSTLNRLLILTFFLLLGNLARGNGGPGFAVTSFPVTVPNNSIFDAYPLTVTTWLRTGPNSGNVGVVNKYVSGSSNGWQIYISATTVSAYYFANSSNFVFNSSFTGGSVADNNWHHVAFVVDAAGGHLYVEGVLKATQAWTGTPAPTTTTANLSLGDFPGQGTYNGRLDEITVWNVALSQSQIQANMNRSLTGNESGLVAYYRCDEVVGHSIHDSAPLGGDNQSTGGSPALVASGVQPFTPFVESLPATVNSTNPVGIMNGVVNPEATNTTVWFEWGPTTNYAYTTPAQSAGDAGTNLLFSYAFSNLTATPYQYRAVASNSLGLVFGTNQTLLIPAFSRVDFGISGSVALHTLWGDFNNDGLLDIVSGDAYGEVIKLWRNTGNGFTNLPTNLPGADPMALTDLNNDGRLDMFLGPLPNESAAPRIALNVVTNFSVAGGPFAAGNAPALATADFNNDGLSDVIVAYDQAFSVGVWINSGSSALNGGFVNLSTKLTSRDILSTKLEEGDLNNDGLADVFLGGSGFGVGVWTNSGNNFVFTNSPFNGYAYFTIDLGDYDNDGLLDLLITGSIGDGTVPVTEVWRNTGNSFSNINAGLTGVYGRAAWGDFDNDGRLDVLLAGGTSLVVSGSILTNPVTQIWRNTGNGFTNLNLNLPGLLYSTVAWGDYDNDGKLDALVTGATNEDTFGGFHGIMTLILHNNSPVTNTRPTAPTGLTATVVSNTATFSWNAASDAETPESGLSYNLRVGTTPGGCEILSPMAASSNGVRLLPHIGNVQMTRFHTLKNIPLGHPIYWSVQAIDGAFAGSPFAPEQVFTLNTVHTGTNGIPVPGDLDGDGIVSQSELSAVLSNLNGNGAITDSELGTILSNYWASSPWLQMTNVAGLGGTNVTFSITNDTAARFTVEYSTNLSTWYFLGPADPRYNFIDTNAPAGSQRYYRLRWP